MSDFTGLVAVVTGGASGLGAATARELLSRGARVAVLDRDLTNAPDGALAVPADITDTGAVDAAIALIAGELGGIDVLVNNAGIGAAGDIAANTAEEWLRVLDVNVVGIARVTSAALPWLRRSDHAAVVNTCSAVAFIGVPNRALYSATKGAVAALTLAMAADHVADGIRVNAVSPGTADTPWVGRILDSAPERDVAAEALRVRQPMGRLVSAEEVAFAVASLASPRAASTTAAVLRVDGGMTSIKV
ncbi:SDR family oxidoreductase [Microbacterium sp.]|uniref:SDR family NAD(P)-dependent oxidoreductase n=1 Tax=Microbacterium sp. TaxID=51671 RepID=UPI00289C0180|nr:SDR family oxidoreductase [Microbacterium sp.]